MSATIVKFKLQTSRPKDQPDQEVKEYVQTASIKVDSPEDSEILKELGVESESDESICIYLVELTGGPSTFCGSASFRHSASFSHTDVETIRSSSSYDDDVISLVVDFFKTSLGVPENLFEDHVARGPKFKFSEDFQTPRSPTAMHHNGSFVLRYYELMNYSGDPAALASLPEQDDACLSCASTGRQIQCHQWHASRRKDGMLLIVPRKISFWRRNKGEHGYDTVIICDPRPSTACLSGHEPVSIEPHIPFNGGYPDFLSHSVLIRSIDPEIPATLGPPPRTSFAADFTHYLTVYGRRISRTGNPPSTSTLITKMVAAHYAPLIGFVTFQVSSMRSRGWALQRHTQAEKDAARSVEEDWSRFRCTEYLEDMEAKFDALGLQRSDVIAPYDPKEYAKRMDDWRTWEVDFYWIYDQLRLRRADYDRLTTSMAALADIIGMRQALEETRLQKEEAVRALREAKSIKTLNVIAMAFAPLAWTSALFNMSGEYAPGGPKFWVYFAVALPATFVVFLVTLLADRGYDGRAEWTVDTFWKSFKGILRTGRRKRPESMASRADN